MGGNVSFNVGVDYREHLERSVDRDEVYALYHTAGLDLDTDLRTLASTPAMPSAFVDFLPAPFLRPWDARCLSSVQVAPPVGQLGPVCL